jgi:folate-binding protein YgfZ
LDHEAQIGHLLTQHEQRPQAAWMFSEIQNAKAWVGEPTTEAFVPQMINFELTNGVSFTKGCYPGQEVVARSQYLGKLKRRSFRAQLSETSLLSRSPGLTSDSQTESSATDFNLATYAQGLVGKDVWSASSSHEACGLVVNAAPVFSALGVQLAAIDLLVETSLDAWAKQDLHVGAIDGPSLDAQPMPYEFPTAE